MPDPFEPATNPDRLWSVLDMNAVPPPNEPIETYRGRRHQPVPGHFYALFAEKPTFMPEPHARKFLIDEAFRVFNADGQMQAPQRPELIERVVAPQSLAPNLVIADLNELTDDALYGRASVTYGGDHFTVDTPREVLIDHLMRLNASNGGRNTTGDTVDPDDIGDQLWRDDQPPTGRAAAALRSGMRRPSRAEIAAGAHRPPAGTAALMGA